MIRDGHDGRLRTGVIFPFWLKTVDIKFGSFVCWDRSGRIGLYSRVILIRVDPLSDLSLDPLGPSEIL